jgi:hypothetical protein
VFTGSTCVLIRNELNDVRIPLRHFAAHSVFKTTLSFGTDDHDRAMHTLEEDRPCNPSRSVEEACLQLRGSQMNKEASGGHTCAHGSTYTCSYLICLHCCWHLCRKLLHLLPHHRLVHINRLCYLGDGISEGPLHSSKATHGKVPPTGKSLRRWCLVCFLSVF